MRLTLRTRFPEGSIRYLFDPQSRRVVPVQVMGYDDDELLVRYHVGGEITPVHHTQLHRTSEDAEWEKV